MGTGWAASSLCEVLRGPERCRQITESPGMAHGCTVPLLPLNCTVVGHTRGARVFRPPHSSLVALCFISYGAKKFGTTAPRAAKFAAPL